MVSFYEELGFISGSSLFSKLQRVRSWMKLVKSPKHVVLLGIFFGVQVVSEEPRVIGILTTNNCLSRIYVVRSWGMTPIHKLKH